jgi:hypothetical protein
MRNLLFPLLALILSLAAPQFADAGRCRLNLDVHNRGSKHSVLIGVISVQKDGQKGWKRIQPRKTLAVNQLESFTLKFKNVNSCKGKWKIRVGMQCVTGKQPPLETTKVQTKTYQPSRKTVRFGISVNNRWKPCG